MRKKLIAFFESRKIRRNSVLWLLQVSAPYKWRILLLILLRCFLTSLGVGMAAVNKNIVDMASGALPMEGVIAVAVVCNVVSIVGGLFLSAFSLRLTERYSQHVRKEIYDHILRSVWSVRSAHHSEELLSRLTSDVGVVASGIINVVASLVSVALQFVMAFALLWQYDHTLALFAVITGPVVALFSFAVGRKLKALQEKMQQTEADYRVYLQEQISHADVLKAFGREGKSLEGLDVLQKERLRLVEIRNRWSILLRAGVSGIFSGSYFFAFVSGAMKVASGTITYGTMTAFLSLVGQVQSPVYSMSRMMSQFIGILASGSRLMEINDMPTEKFAVQALPEADGAEIALRDVCFSYSESKRVFDGFSMQVKGGELAVVMGPSGVGKTTLIRMLLGFLSPDSGTAVYRDAAGNEYTCSPETRAWLSYVPQGNTLFGGTIADNLRVGKEDATEDEMRAALEAACALDFVEKLPDGLQTVIGEKAHGLSEGQAQRIAIARALIRPSALLILDEATSALDEETERAILSRLRGRRAGQTCLVITHRRTVLDYADRVILLGEETNVSS